MKFETLAVHAARHPEPGCGAVREPIQLSTTFERDPDGSYPRGHYYSRTSNPNRGSLERAVAALEGGAEAVAFASGSAASFAVFALAAPGGRILASHDCYHGSAKQLREVLPGFGIGTAFVDTTDLAAVRAGLRENTALLWVESPSNPLLRVSDLAALAELAHDHGALLAVDNTFASPVLQRPLTLGADFVMHSTTKYLGGHGDVLGGIVVARETGPVAARLRDAQVTSGAVPSPFDCWLLLRSLPTLPLRVRAQAASALALASRLATHPRVSRVYYPGLPAHPGHALARQQMSGGFGGVLSLEVPGGADAALAVAARVRLFTRATSLGGVESLIEHRASMEGPLSRTPPGLLRLSIGLENVDDLLADLDQALAAPVD
jgi:cystathionine gamma-synthase